MRPRAEAQLFVAPQRIQVSRVSRLWWVAVSTTAASCTRRPRSRYRCSGSARPGRCRGACWIHCRPPGGTRHSTTGEWGRRRSGSSVESKDRWTGGNRAARVRRAGGSRASRRRRRKDQNHDPSLHTSKTPSISARRAGARRRSRLDVQSPMMRGELRSAGGRSAHRLRPRPGLARAGSDLQRIFRW